MLHFSSCVRVVSVKHQNYTHQHYGPKCYAKFVQHLSWRLSEIEVCLSYARFCLRGVQYVSQ